MTGEAHRAKIEEINYVGVTSLKAINQGELWLLKTSAVGFVEVLEDNGRRFSGTKRIAVY